MRSPEHLPCAGKRQFASKAAADERLTHILHDPDRTAQVPRYSFACPHCGTFHLSSRPDQRLLNDVLSVLGLAAS